MTADRENLSLDLLTVKKLRPTSSSRKGWTAERRSDWDGTRTPLSGAIQQLLRAAFEVEPGVLMGLVAGDGGDALDEVENALGLAAFFVQHPLQDFGGLGLAEPALAQEVGSVFVGAGDDLCAGLLDAVDERCW